MIDKSEMMTYIGTKVIRATPMTRQAYNDFRGWKLPADENGADAGFLVEYVDGGQANTPEFEGYVSWSPAEVFERAYQPETAMSFGHAVEMLKRGEKVARAGWNGEGMFLYHVPRNGLKPHPCRDYIAMKTVNHEVVPWVASQSDVLADDWLIFGGEA